MKPLIGNQIIRLQSVDSTNNYANRLIRETGCSEGTVFLAYEQTAGRGQIQNYWESEAGKNLTFSIVLYPTFLEIKQQFMISKVVTLGIYTAVSKYVDGVRIKWPNDIYAGNLKMGGILIENSVMYGSLNSSIVGIGINLNQTKFRSNAPNPVSLQLLTKQHYDPETILSEILAEIDRNYLRLKNGEHEALDREFIATLFRFNEMHSFKDENGLFDGCIVGVNEIGQLLIRRQDDTISEYHFKEVEFLHPLK